MNDDPENPYRPFRDSSWDEPDRPPEREITLPNDRKMVLLVTLLSEVYDDRGVALWLRARQKRWGNKRATLGEVLATGGMALITPTHFSALELILLGRIDEVLTAAEQLVTGAHT